MNLSKEISGEKLPRGDLSSPDSDGRPEVLTTEIKNMSDEEITEKIETILLERIKAGDNQALFQLGQLYFEQEEYEKAKVFFERGSAKGDPQCDFQLGVICYDALAGKPDYKQGFEYMQKVANSTVKRARHLVRAAQYNVGRAYFQGYGTKQSDEDAEKKSYYGILLNRFWLLAADDGSPKGSIKAQTTLGYYYSRPDKKDLKKAFFWHSEACGNGSLESQGALGVMFLLGLGTKPDPNSAFICLREASERGNVYAMGNLVAYYYKRKLHTKTMELAARVSQLENIPHLANETDCLPGYIAKGVSLASFYYARCLQLGLGMKKDEAEAKKYFSKSYRMDPDICAQLQCSTQHGEI